VCRTHPFQDGVGDTCDVAILAKEFEDVCTLLILHPIAAALAGLSTLMGLVAHLRGFGATCFTKRKAAYVPELCRFATRGALDAVLGDQEDDNVKHEREQVWMTLAAMILLLTSGFFFGVRIIAKSQG
jgi:hypothetical protein